MEDPVLTDEDTSLTLSLLTRNAYKTRVKCKENPVVINLGDGLQGTEKLNEKCRAERQTASF